ncbi:hypothetical protein CCACVL1_18352 [Corchorus capsularis]|uniref:Uncharacterized protein n=1 Tax=Corchorus capsularis TaxID=210143 RepID=A0A1R3HLB7_COCAP|nr:hypothetical protein CCACVL1_18352 [Corchorus capsularis]
MADHERRREAVKKQRSKAGEILHANQEMGIHGNFERVIEEIMEGEVDRDGVLQDLSCSCLASSCTAKAA